MPFLIIHELATIFATWGVDNRQGKMLNIAFFSLNLKALWAVLCGQEIKFHVTPKERNNRRHIKLVAPQIGIVVITIIALIYAFTQTLIYPEDADLGLLIVNVFWAIYNANAMTVLIFAAFWTPTKEDNYGVDVKNRLNAQVLA